MSSLLLKFYTEKKNECQKRISSAKIAEDYDEKLKEFEQKIENAEGRLREAQKQLNEKPSFLTISRKSINITKTIKGGRNSNNFTPTPKKEHSRTYSDTLFVDLQDFEENNKNS